MEILGHLNQNNCRVSVRLSVWVSATGVRRVCRAARCHKAGPLLALWFEMRVSLFVYQLLSAGARSNTKSKGWKRCQLTRTSWPRPRTFEKYICKFIFHSAGGENRDREHTNNAKARLDWDLCRWDAISHSGRRSLSVITKMTMRTGTVIMLLQVRDNERRLPPKSDLLLSRIGPRFFWDIYFAAVG